MSTTTWLAHNWGWLILWVWILGGFSAAGEWWRKALKTRHKRRVELARARAAAPPAPSAALLDRLDPRPGPCVHRNVTPVIATGEDKPVAWLCRCGEQLPADWAVRQEDL